MDENYLKRIFQGAIRSKDTAELLIHFIDKSACFRQGLAKDERTENYNRGWGDFGLYIRSLFLNYAPEIYANIIKEGVKDNE